MSARASPGPVEPLGGHVPHRADDVAGVRQVVGADRLGQAEVGHPDVAVAVQQQVRRLDVAVQDALAVGVGQRLGHLDADPRHALGKPAVGLREESRRPSCAGTRSTTPDAEARPAGHGRRSGPVHGSVAVPVTGSPLAPTGREPPRHQRQGDVGGRPLRSVKPAGGLSGPPSPDRAERGCRVAASARRARRRAPGPG